MSRLSLPAKLGLLGTVSLSFYGATLLAAQHKMLYMARSYKDKATIDYYKHLVARSRERVVDLSYEVKDEASASVVHRARYVKPKGKGDTHLWVMFGGNAMLALDFLDYCFLIQDTKELNHVSFLLIDYPGYGDNPGYTSPDSIQATASAALLQAQELFPIKQVSAMGVSLGCAAALNFAVDVNRKQPACPITNLILCCPFSSILNIAKHHRVIPSMLPNSLATLFIRDALDWDNKRSQRALLGLSDVNLSYFHGTLDEICPISMSEELVRDAQALGKSAELHRLENCDHNSVFDAGMPKIIQAMIRSTT